MKIHIISDLHLDLGTLDLPSTDADVVVLAGDIRPKIGGLKWIRETIKDKPVVYILGNHEFWGGSIPHLIEKLHKEAQDSNVYVLENESVILV